MDELKPPPMTLPTAGLVYMGLTGLPEHAYSAQQMRDFEAARDQQWLALVGELQRDAARWRWMWNHANNVSFTYRIDQYTTSAVSGLHCGTLKDVVDAARGEKGGV